MVGSRALIVAFLLAVGCCVSAHADTHATRVVSLDYCADQFVLKLLPRERILALSPDAEKDFSYMRAAAAGIATVRPVAEDVLTITPDLIVRSYGGGPRATGFFERAGIAVLQVPYANDIDAIGGSITFLAKSLGVPLRGEQIVAEMNARLSNIRKSQQHHLALYMTPTGVTSGPGTLVHEMLVAAGLGNFQEQPGWRSLPLERLAYESPDVIAGAFFDADTVQPAMWSAMRHPVARQQVRDRPTVLLQGAWTACGGWFLLDAIEALAAASSSVDSQ